MTRADHNSPVGPKGFLPGANRPGTFARCIVAMISDGNASIAVFLFAAAAAVADFSTGTLARNSNIDDKADSADCLPGFPVVLANFEP
jgi:hypothetical protein